MSITAAILRILIDAGRETSDFVAVAEAMDTGDGASRIFHLVDELQALDASPEVISIAVCGLSQSINSRRAKQGFAFRSADNCNSPSGPSERWGYGGPITPRLPEREWWSLRRRILERDDHTCRYCGDQPERMCADHVIPLSRGGTNDEDNLVACCLPCNSSKSDRLLNEWQGRLTA